METPAPTPTDAKKKTRTARPVLLTAKELSAALGCSTKTLSRMVRAGEIPWYSLRNGTRRVARRFDLGEVLVALQSKRGRSP